MIKAVIFDMDGVIIDSEPLHFESDKMVMMDYDKELTDEELDRYVGVSNPEMWEDLRVRHQLSVPLQDLLERQMQYKKLLFGNRELVPIEGIQGLLKELKERDVRIGLASSSAGTFISFVLGKLGLEEYFDVVVSGDDVENSKPAPDIFLKTACLLKINPSDCIVIEDAEKGVTAAKLSKMKCIGYQNSNSGNQNLTQADIIVASILDIHLEEVLI